VAILAPRLRKGDDALDVEAGLAVRVDGEAERVEPLKGRANSLFGMKTSPPASSVAGSFSRSGTDLIVRRFAVTSSPVVPSPRVAPWTNRPRSKRRVIARPSILSSAT
jgi:hypothetical protein